MENSSDSSPAVVVQIEPISVGYKKAAELLGVASRQVRTLAMLGEITPIRMGKRDVFSVEELREFLRKKLKAAA
jgi:hypothetical protein